MHPRLRRISLKHGNRMPFLTSCTSYGTAHVVTLISMHFYLLRITYGHGLHARLVLIVLQVLLLLLLLLYIMVLLLARLCK